jgi:cytochrome c oxidase subunit III
MSTVAGAHAGEHRDDTGARMGMWLFLFTELILFSGLFLLYAVQRYRFGADFTFAAATLDTAIGTLNTAVLLSSSLTMVLAVVALQQGKRGLSVTFLSLTFCAGIAFMVNKYFEWTHKFELGLYPGSEELTLHTPGEQTFYSLYYAMTGLHGIHVLIGMGVIMAMIIMTARRPRRVVRLRDVERAELEHLGRAGEFADEGQLDEVQVTLLYAQNETVTERSVIRVENTGLYWHVVDVIWIFLFPLFYLIG